jgi:UPF0716 protein FxsA
MGRALFAVFVIVPIIEIALFVLLGDVIGFWWTMAGVVATAIIGSLLLRWQGLAVLVRIRAALNQGAFPARPIADGMMLAIAGALLLTPGFFTDTVGFLLFVPLVRTAVYRFLRERVTVVASASMRPGSRDFDYVDLGEDDWHDDPKRRS